MLLDGTMLFITSIKGTTCLLGEGEANVCIIKVAIVKSNPFGQSNQTQNKVQIPNICIRVFLGGWVAWSVNAMLINGALIRSTNADKHYVEPTNVGALHPIWSRLPMPLLVIAFTISQNNHPFHDHLLFF